MKRILSILMVALFMVAMMAVTASVAFAGDFGAGNSPAGPHDANAKCHPPGQTTGDPGC